MPSDISVGLMNMGVLFERIFCVLFHFSIEMERVQLLFVDTKLIDFQRCK